jgi:hypothetical protein
MAKQYRYVVVSSDGISHDLWPTWEDYQKLDDALEESADEYDVWTSRPTLPQLLADGWRPVRETAMGGGNDNSAYALVLLEKD